MQHIRAKKIIMISLTSLINTALTKYMCFEMWQNKFKIYILGGKKYVTILSYSGTETLRCW